MPSPVGLVRLRCWAMDDKLPLADRGQRSVPVVRWVAGTRLPATRSLIAQSQGARADCVRTLSYLVSAPWGQVTAPWGQRTRDWCLASLTRRRDPIEVALVGGNITTGVVRVGDTVRRPRGAASPFTEQLLRHLQSVGFTGAPQWLGVDDQGRDVFSYLPGRVAALNEHLSDQQVVAVGTLLRAFHDATRRSVLAAGQETVCHRDCGPHNIVFGEHDQPYAMIDFDLAGPGEALADISYSAWLCCINSAWLKLAPLEDQARQLRLLTDSYGLQRRRRRELLDALGSRQLESIRWAKQCLAGGEAREGVREHAARTLVGCKREHLFVFANRTTFERALR